MDPVYVQQPQQHTVWSHPGVLPMEYSTYPHPQFSSPPATPMTPITPVTLHHAFPVAQYDMPPGAVYHNPPPPPPPPFPPPPDYRLYALCQQLQNYSKVQESDTKAWWEEFMTEYFHENSTLVIEVDLGEGTRKFRLARQWIALYFKSLLENGVTSVHLELGQCISAYTQGLHQFECRNAVMETHHSTPQPTKVCTSGTLVVDFSLEEKPRIISWYFSIKDHMEYVPRSNVGQGEEPGVLGNITCRGILPATQKLLLEAGLMESGYHGSTAANPTAAALHNQWQDVPGLIHMQPGTTIPDVLVPPQEPNIITHPGLNSPVMTNGKQKLTRSTSHGGSRKGKTSPLSTHSENGFKKDQYLLVAAEAIPLTDAREVLAATFGYDERTITRVDNQTTMSCSGALNHTSSLTKVNGEATTNSTATTTKLSHLDHHHGISHTHSLDTNTLMSGSSEFTSSLQGPSIWSPDGSSIGVTSASLSSS